MHTMTAIQSRKLSLGELAIKVIADHNKQVDATGSPSDSNETKLIEPLPNKTQRQANETLNWRFPAILILSACLHLLIISLIGM